MTENQPVKQKRTNGAGSVVKLKYKDKTGATVESRYFYILYRQNGRQIRESSKSESKMVAQKLLERRLGEAGMGLRPVQDVKNVKYDEIAAGYLDQQRTNGVAFFRKADGTEYLRGVPNLEVFFKGRRVMDINPDVLRSYIDHRTKAGAQGPTIRRELVTLRAIFRLAHKEGTLRLADIPYFPMPPDSKARTGFVNPDVFDKLLKELPAKLRPLVNFVYHTGCRIGAARQITWAMINQDATEVRLPGEITKNGEPLTLSLLGYGLDRTLRRMFRKEGRPVFDATNLRREWAGACHKLGLGVKDGWRYKGLKIHDLRRSAVRNLVRAGVSETVAMTISGHKTRHVFDRYNITDAKDIHDALIKVGEYAKIQRKAGRLSAMRKAK